MADTGGGDNQLPFCVSNFLVPENKAEVVGLQLYPNVMGRSFVAKEAGHALNFYFVVGEAYQQISESLGANGFRCRR